MIARIVAWLFPNPPVEHLLGVGDPVVDQSLAIAHWPGLEAQAEIDLLESWLRIRSR